jgi:hypothetical protein
VGESAEDPLAADPELGEVDRFRRAGASLSWADLAEGTVRRASLWCRRYSASTRRKVVLIDDQLPVQELAAQGVGDPPADRIAPHRQLHPIRMIGTDAPV